MIFAKLKLYIRDKLICMYHKKLLALAAIGLVLLATQCSPKTGKNTTSSDSSNETTTAPAEVAFADKNFEEQKAFVQNFNAERIQSGQQIYEAKCGKCHKLHDPADREANGWLKVMRRMAPKAKLSDGEYALVSGYLLNHAK